MPPPKNIPYLLAVTVLFGTLAYLTRASDLITPLGGVFVLDLRDFFVAIGAVIGGPVPGLVIGILAGLPASQPVIDIAAFGAAGLTVGFFSSYFFKKNIPVAYSAGFMLTGYFVAGSVVLLMFPNLLNVSLLTRALICTPLNVVILYNLLNAYPRFLGISRNR